jgi:hypothetical protein
MPKFNVEYKTTSEEDGLKSVSQYKKIEETTAASARDLIPMGLNGVLVEDLEYLIIRRVKEKVTK